MHQSLLYTANNHRKTEKKYLKLFISKCVASYRLSVIVQVSYQILYMLSEMWEHLCKGVNVIIIAWIFIFF